MAHGSMAHGSWLMAHAPWPRLLAQGYGTTNIGYGTTNADAGVGIGLKGGFKKLTKRGY